jgi:hypothetical protein
MRGWRFSNEEMRRISNKEEWWRGGFRAPFHGSITRVLLAHPPPPPHRWALKRWNHQFFLKRWFFLDNFIFRFFFSFLPTMK